MHYAATIIIPCYNKEAYIGRALDSIIAQSRFSEFEVIVVDDCSTDGSAQIVDLYANKYANIQFVQFEQGSGSPSRPRNVAIEMSSADYLIFMDPDDQIINDGYSTLLTKMEQYRSDILIAARIGVTETGEQAFIDYIDERFTFINQNTEEIRLDLLNRRPFILKTIYSKALIIDNNIRFNENICTSEDESFDMQCVAHAKHITKVNDIVYQYTVESKDSITTGVKLRMYEDLYDVMVELYGAYKLMFSDEIIAERILSLVDVFYIYRMSFFKKYSNIKLACEYLYDAVEKFGYDKFEGLVIARKNIDLLEAIKARDISEYVEKYLIKRISVITKRAKGVEKELRQLKKQQKKLQSKLNRKIVKPGVYLAEKLDVLSGKSKNAAGVNPNTQRESDDDRAQFDYLKRFESFIGNDDSSLHGYWVFMDRPDNAKDNGEALYRYVMRNKLHDKLAFLLNETSIDKQRLLDEGFNVVNYDSLEHWVMLKNAEFFFTSHCDGLNLYPWYYIGRDVQSEIKDEYPISYTYKLVFLQHGVIRSNLSGWLGGKPYYKFVASASPERASLLGIPHYRLTENQVILTGLARWDYLKDESQDYIAIFPTWRKSITFSKDGKYEQKLLDSAFYRNWIAFCNGEAIAQIAKTNTVRFFTHHDNMKMIEYLKPLLPPYIEIVSYNDIESFSHIVNTAKMLITDYSSISFDFLYLNKPVLYFDFDQNALKNNIRDEEYERFGYYATEVEEANEALSKILMRDFKIEDKYSANISQLLPIRNAEHCKLIMQRVLEGSIITNQV